jgi:hypothetical protein
MKRAIGLLSLVFALSACSPEKQPPPRPDPAPTTTTDRVEPIKMGSATEPVKDKAPPPPEPTTPEEIDAARKQAMIDGRDKDVIRFCEMAKVDPEDKKTDPQVLLGCALASCRIGEVDKAKTWAKPLPKVLKDQAIKICMASNVTL